MADRDRGADPAFPTDSSGQKQEGMTLRDWFAGQALVGLLSGEGDEWPAEIAERAYSIAQAMIERRNRL